MKKYLVAYHSDHGSTKEVAEIIGNQLGNSDVLHFRDVSDVSMYDVVIVGSPINGMKWHKFAHEFILRNLQTLKEKDVYVFALTIIYKTGRSMWRNAIKNAFKMDKNLLPIKGEAFFGGRTEAPMTWFLRFVFGLSKDLPLDQRDETEINGFVEMIKNDSHS